MNLPRSITLGLALMTLWVGTTASGADATTNSAAAITNNVTAIQNTLARARAIAEKMETNGFRTNATGHLLVSFAMLSGFKCELQPVNENEGFDAK
ncbi:MAG: hypothetical protein IPK15_12085 [Verrucomicrobia bacterium]|nr:hypothetical protein [Verrucomicrobiota bacterium]